MLQNTLQGSFVSIHLVYPMSLLTTTLKASVFEKEVKINLKNL